MNAYIQIDQGMVAVPGGSFIMGNNAYPNEQPLHTVYVEPFEIGKNLITQAIWLSVMGSNPSHFQDDPQLPVDQVSWLTAMEFVKELRAQTGLPYRLPSENEWEFSARGGHLCKGFQRAGGDDLNAVAWYNGNAGFRTHPVGQKLPNELGIYDMNGNVWEWCEDFVPKDYSNPDRMPSFEKSAASNDRILRGGSYINYAVFCRPTYRWIDRPDNVENYIGLRLARGF